MGRGKAHEEVPQRLRLDKWIWFARFQRARERCADLIRAGHVRVNGRRETAPGAFVKVGDVLTLALPGRTEVVRVLALGEARGGAQDAAGLYSRIGDEKENALAQ
jgi:ribosome-associated heat shock protein Hsp15